MNNRRLRILISTNIPSPYFVDYCNELGSYCDVTVLFEITRAKDRDNTWYKNSNTKLNFKPVFLNGLVIGKESGFSTKIIKYMNPHKYDRIIIANPTTPSGILALLYCRYCRVPFIIQSEGGFQGSGKGIKEWFKKYIMEKATIYLTGMGSDNDYFLMYGATKEKLRKYPFSSLMKTEIDHNILFEEEKRIIKEKLKITESVIIISVGRVLPSKGFDTLLYACIGLPKRIGIYIIGGKPSQDCLQIVHDNKMTNVHFIDFCESSVLKQYYQASDIFVLATRYDTWGLVINEAMANGLPVITTDKCIAGISLITDGKNGFIVPANDPIQLSEKISKLIDDKDLRVKMGATNIALIQEYSIENMARIIYQHLLYL